MGGEVALSGAPGKGLVAQVKLAMPLVPEPPAGTVAPATPGLPPLMVLAAEDNATNRIILHSILTSLGVTAEIVPSGHALLARWQEETFDALLLDIAMPGLDGVETLRELQARGRASGRPVPPALAVTANAMTHQLADYLGQGFAAVVPKPLRAEDLGRALAAVIRPEVQTP
jgi:CheY-like chemotaxis protein